MEIPGFTMLPLKKRLNECVELKAPQGTKRENVYEPGERPKLNPAWASVGPFRKGPFKLALPMTKQLATISPPLVFQKLSKFRFPDGSVEATLRPLITVAAVAA